MRRMRLFAAALAAAAATRAALAAPLPPPSPPAASPGTTTVSYIAGGSVYLDAGTLDGLGTGDTVRVSHAGSPVALLKVAYTSTRRAACDTVWTRGPLAIGDAARFAPRKAPAPPKPQAAPVARRRSPENRLRGRLGMRWLAMDIAGGRFRQPALDVRLDGNGEAGGHLDLALDMRSRRTTRDFDGASRRTDEMARVYRATLTLRSTNARRAVTVGRQTSPTLASINLFDGVLVRTGTDRRTFGAFTGSEPDPSGYSFSRELVQSGAFVEWRERPRSERHWTIALGGVASQEHGVANRDFLFGQGSWSSAAFTGSVAQEVDMNLGWRRHLGDPALSPTSTFANSRLALGRYFAVDAGFDNRRNVRLYRDRLTPETEFDDAYRQGAWIGGEVQAARRFRFSAERRSAAGTARSREWSWNADAFRLGPMHLSGRARVSQYDGGLVSSRLSSGGFGVEPFAALHLDGAAGVRRTRIAGGNDDIERWQSLDADLTLGTRWYWNGGWEHDRGGSSGQARQLQTGLNWRF